MGYVTGFFAWIWANLLALVIGGFVGYLFGGRLGNLLNYLWRKTGG